MQALWLGLLLACSCVGPLVSDTPGPGAVRPPGAVVPTLADDQALATRVRVNDGANAVVPLLAAFRGGTPIRYWDFGPAPATLATMFVLVDDKGVRLSHPPILVDAPGDPRYSPFFRVIAVRVTSRYAGEVISSAEALEDAESYGLVESEPETIGGVDAPVLGIDVKLGRRVGAPTPPLGIAYYQGVAVPQEQLGAVPLTQFGGIRVASRYVLRRPGEEPISEPLRGVDFTGDGDNTDCNDVMGLVTIPAAPAVPSPACQTVNVVVAGTMRGIDSSQDQGVSDVTNATQLFSPGPVMPLVIAFTTTSEVRNCPVAQ
jgi:hypothetical protein